MTKLEDARVQKLAEEVRKSLPPNKQSEVFQLAVEAGYLTALADGQEDVAERDALVDAVEQLSQGLVLEWEVEQVLDETAQKLREQGAEGLAAAIGARLKELGAAEPGLFVAALVALASGGLDRTEAQALQNIGSAAGLSRPAVGEIVKRAR